MFKHHTITFQLTQSKTVTFIVDAIPCTYGSKQNRLRPFHLIDDSSYHIHKDTLNAIECLTEEQRWVLFNDISNSGPNGEETAKFIFKKAKLPLPKEKDVSKSSSVIKFPSRYIKKDKNTQDNIIDTKNMSVVDVLKLGSDMSPVAFHSNKLKLNKLSTYQDRWVKAFGKTDRHSLRDLIETSIFLCNGHTVHFNLRKGCDKKDYLHHIFNTLARIGCKAVRGSTGKSNSFISALDVPDSLRAFVDGLSKDYVEQVLSIYDNVYAYEISKTKGIKRAKNKEAEEWTKAVKAYMEAVQDKVITQFNARVSISHTLKVSKKGMLNRETVKGVCLNKKLRSNIRMQSLSGSMDSIVELDTCGAYMNQLRMMSGLEAVDDPYIFLDTDRDTAKDVSLRLLCGASKRQVVRHLKDEGCDQWKAEELVDTFLETYKPFKKCWEIFNNQQQLVMTEIYKLATSYKMAFIANCDGILVAKSDAILAKSLYQKAWLNVTGKLMPVKIKAKDYEEHRKAA